MTVTSIGKIAAATPGTPVRVTNDLEIFCHRIMFAVIPGNTGKTYIGTAGMQKSTLTSVARVFTAPNAGPQDGMILPPSGDGTNAYRLADFYVDSDTAGDGVLVTYWVA